MTQYQDQGSLDQPQQGVQRAPGVIPPDEQSETVSPESVQNEQVAGGGAVDGTGDEEAPAEAPHAPQAPQAPQPPAAPEQPTE